MSEIRPLKDKYGRAARFFTGDGANGTWTFTIKDTSGTAVNLTGKSIRAIIRDEIDSTTNLVGAITATLLTQSGDTLGQFTVNFSSVNLTVQYTRAVLIIYEVVSSKNQMICAYALDIVRGIAV